MNKIRIFWIILDLIFLIIFNTIFFVAGGTQHNVATWISYGFIHFAYLMLVLTPFMIRKGKSSATYGGPLYSISAAYFLVGLATGVIFIPISPETHTAALLVQLTIAGIYGIILITNLIANEHTANAEQERQYQIAYVKDASVKLKGLLDSINDKDAKRKAERVYDAVYSSPVKSHPSLAQIENRILQSINELEDEVFAGNKENIISSANSLLATVNE